MLNHQHYLVDCFVKKPLIKVEDTINWLKKLVDTIDMKIVAGPIAAYCDSEGNEGITGSCCIATSHCSIHVWDKAEYPYMKLDVYSCQTFDEKLIDSLLQEFEPYNIVSKLIDRNPVN